MAILTESQRQAVAQQLQGVTAPVEVELFVRDTRLIIPGRECPRCEETVQLLEEVCALSPHLRLTVRDLDRELERGRELGVERTPTLVIHGRAAGRVRFVGAPLGYEFASLLEALVEAGRPASTPEAGADAGRAGAGAEATAPRPPAAHPGDAGAAAGSRPDGAGPEEGEASPTPTGPLDPRRLARLEEAGETVHLRVFFTPT